MLVKVFVGLTLASSALANVFITSPFETTSYSAGQEAMIQWQDDGIEPTLEQFGPAKFSIYTGNANEQTLLQEIQTSVDVSQVSSLTFTPSASIGPDSNQYFIRVESLSAMDPTNPSIPALAFSSRFSLAGMSGEFSDIASSQIAAQSTAPLTTLSSSSSPFSSSSYSSGSSISESAKGTGSTRITTMTSAKSVAATSASPSSASSKSTFSYSSSSLFPPSTASSAPNDLATGITAPSSSAMLGAQTYTGLLVTLLGALVGVVVL